jgi:hypothetical protein
MAKAMNHKRRLRALEKAQSAARRDPVALALALRRTHVVHPDKRKRNSKRACRAHIPR